MKCDAVDWIGLAQDRGQWMALLNLQVPKKWCEVIEFLRNWDFSRRVQDHGLS
jgi:hypothetical protein